MIISPSFLSFSCPLLFSPFNLLLSFFLVFVLQYFLPSFVIFSLIHYFFLLPNQVLHSLLSLLSTFSSIFVICLPSLSTLSFPGPLHRIFSIPFFTPSSFLISLSPSYLSFLFLPPSFLHSSPKFSNYFSSKF